MQEPTVGLAYCVLVGSGNVLVLATVVGTGGTLVGAAAGVLGLVQARQKTSTPETVRPSPDEESWTEHSIFRQLLVLPWDSARELISRLFASLLALCLALLGWFLILIIGTSANTAYALLRVVILVPSFVIALRTGYSQMREIIFQGDDTEPAEYPYILAIFIALILAVVTDVIVSNVASLLA
jgi:hypothetical protein